MEDDDDIHSHPFAGSGSEYSEPSNHRISVTVASGPPQNTLTLALPTPQPRTVPVAGGSGGGGGGGGREDCWSEGATAVLIEAWGERYLELSRGNLKQKHWKEVADIVRRHNDYLKAPKTDVQCKNRIDTVKKKYKLEKAKIASTGGRSSWTFYDRMDQLIGSTATGKSGLRSLATPLLKSVPVGIPVQSLRLKQQQQQQVQQQRKRLLRPSDSSESDSYQQKRARVSYNAMRQQKQKQEQEVDIKGRGLREKSWGDSVRELTKVIMKFGEAYEVAESAKLQQMLEMQKQSMKFAKELELQRMQFFMKTQLEMSQLKHSRRNVENNHLSGNHKQQ